MAAALMIDYNGKRMLQQGGELIKPGNGGDEASACRDQGWVSWVGRSEDDGIGRRRHHVGRMAQKRALL